MSRWFTVADLQDLSDDPIEVARALGFTGDFSAVGDRRVVRSEAAGRFEILPDGRSFRWDGPVDPGRYPPVRCGLSLTEAGAVVDAFARDVIDRERWFESTRKVGARIMVGDSDSKAWVDASKAVPTAVVVEYVPEDVMVLGPGQRMFLTVCGEGQSASVCAMFRSSRSVGEADAEVVAALDSEAQRREQAIGYVQSLGWDVGAEPDPRREVRLESLRAGLYSLPATLPQTRMPIVWMAYGRRSLEQSLRRASVAERPLEVFSFAPAPDEAFIESWRGRVTFIPPARP